MLTSPTLDALPQKRRAFVLAFVGEAMGNASRAAELAGYARPRHEGHRLLQLAPVRDAIEALRERSESEAVASRQERQRFLTTAMRDEGAKLRDRLRACELLGKMSGDFLERHQIEGSAGPQVKLVIVDNGRGPLPPDVEPVSPLH